MDLQWKALATQVLGFLIVLWLLRKYAWQGLLDFIEKRRETIAAEFDTIEKTKVEAESLRERYNEELSSIEATRRVKIQEAVHEANELASNMKDAARQEALSYRSKATQEIEIEIDKANLTLRDRMVDAVVVATEKLIHERLDDEKHRQLINDFLGEVDFGGGTRKA